MLLPKGTKLVSSKLLLFLCLPNIATHRASEIFFKCCPKTSDQHGGNQDESPKKCLDCEVQVSVDHRQFRTYRAKETDQEI